MCSAPKKGEKEKKKEKQWIMKPHCKEIARCMNFVIAAIVPNVCTLCVQKRGGGGGISVFLLRFFFESI